MQKEFPAPRYPKVGPISYETLVDRIERHIVNRKIPKSHIGGLFASEFDFGPKDRVLLVSATEHDPTVASAYADAFRRKGAVVDVYQVDLGTLGPPEDAAVCEATSLVPGDDNPVYTIFCDLITPATARAMVQTMGYTAIVAGTAGPYPVGIPARWKRASYVYAEEIASAQIELPLDVLYGIDAKVVEQIRSIERGRLTDPEGTDVTWTNYDDRRPLAVAHEFGKPHHIGFGGEPDCSGVIGGTINHVSAFPHAKAYLKDDLVVKVEGGGKYGDAWREKLEELNKVELPPVGFSTTGHQKGTYKLPSPGFFWFWEMAIGTIPGVFRIRRESQFKCFANFLHDRRRSGIVHNGFGAPTGSKPMLVKAGIPWTHLHLQSMFPTLEGTTKDGERVTVIEKGHLTALDDPGVRSLTAKHGDPEVLLREAWIPAIPGINAEGDYWKDYANDPPKWILRESEKLP